MRYLIDTHILIWYLREPYKLTPDVYARLRINETQEHNDPSDHVIISHAITSRMPLISADTRFPWYRSQGLELVSNKAERG